MSFLLGGAGTLASWKKKETELAQPVKKGMRGQQRERVAPCIPISAEAIRARLEGLDALLRRDPCRVNAFFRDHLSPIMCEPVEQGPSGFTARAEP